MAQRYVLNTPTSGVCLHNGKQTAMTIPEASIVEVTQALDGIKGLIEVTFRGDCILMFAEDIRLKGKPAARTSR